MYNVYNLQADKQETDIADCLLKETRRLGQGGHCLLTAQPFVIFEFLKTKVNI